MGFAGWFPHSFSPSLIWWAVVGLAISMSCSEPQPDKTTTSRFIRYHHWADEPPCQDALDRLDDLVGFVSSEFKLPLPKEPLNYFKWRTTQYESVARLCPRDAPACAFGTTAHSQVWAHDHEVVHALFAPVGNPPNFFKEGIANVLGCGLVKYAGPPIETEADLKSLLSDAKWDSEYKSRGSANYDLAASFVRFLIDFKGRGAFVSFYAEASEQGVERTISIFQKIYGVSLDAAIEQWRTNNSGRAGSYCIIERDPCLNTPTLDQRARTIFSRPLSCAGGVVSFDSTFPTAQLTVLSEITPVVVSIGSCFAPSDWNDHWVVPPEVFLGTKKTTLNRPLQLAFQIPPRRTIVQYQADLYGGGNPWLPSGEAKGEITFRVKPPDGLLVGSEALPVQLEDYAWAFHLEGRGADLPADGGRLQLRSFEPVLWQQSFTRDLARYSAEVAVDSRCAPSCLVPDAGVDALPECVGCAWYRGLRFDPLTTGYPGSAIDVLLIPLPDAGRSYVFDIATP
jgi:hypothetical protein